MKNDAGRSGARAVTALAKKDLRLLVRDKMGFFFTLVFPLAMAVFFGTVFRGQQEGEGPKGIPIVIVDEDGTERSAKFVETLIAAPEFAAERLATRPEAEDIVRRGERTAYVILAPGFGEASERMFWGDPAKLEVGVDPSRSAEAGMLEGLLTKYGFERMQEMFTNPDASRASTQKAMESLAESDAPPATRALLTPFLSSLDAFMTGLPEVQAQEGEAPAGAFGSAGWQPMVIERVSVGAPARRDMPQNAYAVSFPQGIIWGVIGACAAFGLSLVTERNRGTLIRLRLAPLRRAHILGGKALACFLVTVAVSTMLLLIAAAVFGVRPVSPGLLAISVVCIAVCFVGLMMLLACLGRTEAAASGLSWAVLLVMAMIGGGMVPRFIMPDWMLMAGAISPVSWAMRALEGPMWRGLSFVEMLPIYGVLLGVGVVCFAAGARAFRWQE